MKKLKLSESQIIQMVNEAEQGVAVVELCRKYKVANSTFYKLKSKYTGMNVSDLQLLKELERENNRLKQMYADISLEHKILKDVMEKSSNHSTSYFIFSHSALPFTCTQITN